MAETACLRNVFNHRDKIFHLGRGQNRRYDSLFRVRYGRAIYRKNGNAFSDALFYCPDNSLEREEKTDRMPKLQGAVSDGIVCKNR